MSKRQRNIGLFILSLGLFTLLSFYAAQNVLPADRTASEFFGQIESPLLTLLARFLDFVGNGYILAAVGFILAILLWEKRRRYATLLLSLGLFGGFALNLILKALFARPRPEHAERLVEVLNYSYPSGHTMGATLFSILFVFWLKNMYDLTNKQYFIAQLVAFLFLASVGVSRVYSQAHYASDVLGGWLAGLMWISFIFTLRDLDIWRQNRRSIE